MCIRLIFHRILYPYFLSHLDIHHLFLSLPLTMCCSTRANSSSFVMSPTVVRELSGTCSSDKNKCIHFWEESAHRWVENFVYSLGYPHDDNGCHAGTHLKTDLDHFHPCPSQFIIRNHPSILHYSVYVADKETKRRKQKRNKDEKKKNILFRWSQKVRPRPAGSLGTI